MSEPTNDELMQRLEAALQREEDDVRAATEKARIALEQQRLENRSE